MKNIHTNGHMKENRNPTMIHALQEFRDASEDSITQLKDQVTESTLKAARKVDHKIHQNPWPFIGGASALSVFAGYLLGRRSKRE